MVSSQFLALLCAATVMTQATPWSVSYMFYRIGTKILQKGTSRFVF